MGELAFSFISFLKSSQLTSSPHPYSTNDTAFERTNILVLSSSGERTTNEK